MASEPRYFVAAMGPASSGKTTILQQLLLDRFTDRPLPTNRIQEFCIQAADEHGKFAVQISDYSGADISLVQAADVRRFNAVVFIASYDDQFAIGELNKWTASVAQFRHLSGRNALPHFFVFNKCDISVAERKCDERNARAEFPGQFWTVSARERRNVAQLLATVLAAIRDQNPEPGGGCAVD
jgi:GTPase SAR1 family protein